MDLFWLEQRLADVPASDEWLSAGEVARLQALKIPKRRADWRLGRWTAKRAVAELLGIPHDIAKIEIIAEPSGAPKAYLSGEPAGVALSLSHRAGIGACAVVEHGVVGCDLELIELREPAFLADYFTEGEQTWIANSDEPQRARLATILWSAKESALKAMHEGLRRDTRDVSVVQVDVAEPSSWGALRVSCGAGELFEGWWCEADGLVRTLVAAPAPAIPTCLEPTLHAMV